MALVAAENPTVEFALFAFVAQGFSTEAEKVAVLKAYFGRFSDDPYIRTEDGRIKVSEYVREALYGVEPYAVSEIISGDFIIREYLDARSGYGAGREKMDELYSKLDSMYTNFKKR